MSGFHVINKFIFPDFYVKCTARGTLQIPPFIKVYVAINVYYVHIVVTSNNKGIWLEAD
jgi:hypothetical protein